MEEEKFLTAPEAAKLLEISSQTLRRWSAKGILIPHHILPSGYRYYSEKQIKDFLNENQSGDSCVKKGTTGSKSKKNNLSGTKNLTPMFKLFVDSGKGKVWVSYYSMRSGKTNSLAYANNPKLFGKVTEMIAGHEIALENDECRFVEPMHDVTITLSGRFLENLNATIAKGVFWIQMLFTERIGHNNPSDSDIESARYMKWKIDDYMKYCGLSDRKNAISSMRKTLSVLSQAIIEWREEIIVRDDNGQPIYSGYYRDQNGKMIPRVKKTMQIYRGSFISTHGLNVINGGFEFWVNKEFATYLAHAGVIAVHENFFKLDAQKSPGAITLAVKLSEYYSMNYGTNQANVISVKSLLNAMPSIPKYKNLIVDELITTADGNEKKYIKHGGKGGWKFRIKKPFEDAFDSLVNFGILSSWTYREKTDPASYDEFIRQFIHFEFKVNLQDYDK